MFDPQSSLLSVLWSQTYTLKAGFIERSAFTACKLISIWPLTPHPGWISFVTAKCNTAIQTLGPRIGSSVYIVPTETNGIADLYHNQFWQFWQKQAYGTWIVPNTVHWLYPIQYIDCTLRYMDCTLRYTDCYCIPSRSWVVLSGTWIVPWLQRHC